MDVVLALALFTLELPNSRIVDQARSKEQNCQKGNTHVKSNTEVSFYCIYGTVIIISVEFDFAKFSSSASKKRDTFSGVKDEFISGKKSRKESDTIADCPASYVSELDPELQSDYLELPVDDLHKPVYPPSADCNRNLASDLAEDCHLVVHRCTVRNISRQSNSLVLVLSDCNKNERIEVTLYGSWLRTEVQLGDTVNVIASLKEQRGTLVAKIDTNEGFLILHPDILIPGSTLPLGTDCMRQGYLKTWMTEHEGLVSDKAVFGNIMHRVVQVALNRYVPYNGEPLDMKEDINKIIASSNEELFQCEQTEAAALQFVQERLPLIKTWLEAYASSTSDEIQVQKVIDVEESIYSPQFGLKGRVDATLTVKISTGAKNRNSQSISRSNRSCSTESSSRSTQLSKISPLPALLKASTTKTDSKQAALNERELIVPLELKTGKEWFSHEAQVMLYFLLMQTRYNREIEDGLLWYLNSPTEMKLVKMQKRDMDGILQVRNHFACYLKEHQTSLPPMLHNVRVCRRCPFLTDCTVLHKTAENGNERTSGLGELFTELTKHLTEMHGYFLRRWLSALDWESADLKRKEAFSWNPDWEASKSAGVLNMRGLVFQNISARENGWLYSFNIVEKQDRFFENEFVLVSIEDKQPGILKGFIRKSSEDIVIVFADACLPQKWRHGSYRWRLDRFCSTTLTTLQRTNLLELVRSQDPLISNLRSLIIERNPPQKRQDVVHESNSVLEQFKTGLNHDQSAAVQRVWDEYDYSLIWGMPGSGKTHTTVQAIRGLVEKNRSVLVSSFTHSAVDNILSRLKDTNVHFLRLGSKAKVHESIHGHLLGSPLFPDTSTTALMKLVEEIQVAVAPLRMQYRMCDQIMAFANHMVYNNELVCADDDVAYQVLGLHNYNNPHSRLKHNWCHEVLRPQRHVMMLDTTSLQFHDHIEGETYVNADEAAIVVDLVSALIDFGLEHKQLGIISPYNGQINKIRTLLVEHSHHDLEVSTVDRFQGRDKDCIIFSFVRSNQKKETGMLLADWRRINVAITRARKKLLLVGDSSTLMADPFLHKAIKYLQDQQSVVKLCQRTIHCIEATAISEKSPVLKDVSPKDAPLRSLFPDEPPPPKRGSPKLRVAIVGGGLAGLSTAVELLDQGYEVEVFEGRKWIGGKVASFIDKNGNHIEWGLHVFFGCYFNLFRLMAKCGVLENLELKDHVHTFINKGGDVRGLDFRLEVNGEKVGAPFHGLKAFFTTPQLSLNDKISNSIALGTSPIVRALFDAEGGMRDVRALDNVSFTDWFKSHGGSQRSIDRLWDPIAYALGFLDCDNISARCMLSIFLFFATKTDASVLRLLNGSPDERLLKPIANYILSKGGKIHTRSGCRKILYDYQKNGYPIVTGLKMADGTTVTADAYVAALDVPGAKKLIPQPWRSIPMFNNIFKLRGVPVITVQLRYDGWVTELKDIKKVLDLESGKAHGIDNLLYSADADFSCFADLALTSPLEYFKEGQGSLVQCVLTPAEKYMPKTNDQIAQEIDRQVKVLFPSAKELTMLWSSVLKIGQSLYEEAPGLDPLRPKQQTDVPNFFLAGSYTAQDYIDSMEGATLSGRQCANYILNSARRLKSMKI
eukprot:g1257.t1